MAIEKEINIRVSDTGLDKSPASAEKLGKNLKKVDANAKDASQSNHNMALSVLENGGAMGLLNDVTGGVAMQIKDGVEAMALFASGTTISTTAQKIWTMVVGTSTGALKAFKVALVTTGVGALVVGLGLLIQYMSDSTEATEEQVKAQDLLNASIAKTTELLKDELSGIDYVTKARLLRAEAAGKSETDLRKIEEQAHEERLAAIKMEQQRLQELQDNKNTSLEQSKEINKKLSENTQAYINELNAYELSGLEYKKKLSQEARDAEREANEERLAEIKKTNEERLAKEKEYQKQLLEELRNFNLIRFQVENDEFDRDFTAKQEKDALLKELRGQTELQKLEEDRLNAIATLDAAKASQAEYLEAALAFEQKKTDIENAQSEERVKIRQAERDQKLAIQNAELDLASSGAGLLKQIAGKNKTLQKTAIIIENAAAIAKVIANTVAANAKAVAMSPATGGMPWVGINTASAAIGIASTVMATRKALKEVGGGDAGGGSAPGGGGGGGGAPPPPQFNIVDTNPNNQLAQSIANQQGQPVEAYVVSGNVTTAQGLDRNRVETATFNN